LRDPSLLRLGAPATGHRQGLYPKKPSPLSVGVFALGLIAPAPWRTRNRSLWSKGFALETPSRLGRR
jgi:hypothetical protein